MLLDPKILDTLGNRCRQISQGLQLSKGNFGLEFFRLTLSFQRGRQRDMVLDTGFCTGPFIFPGDSGDDSSWPPQLIVAPHGSWPFKICQLCLWNRIRSLEIPEETMGQD